MPVESPASSTSNIVTAAMAPPRKSVRRVCCTRLRKAIAKSMASLDMVLLLLLHGLARRDAHGEPRRVEAGCRAHEQHDDERGDDVRHVQEWTQARAREEEEPRVRRRGNTNESDELDDGRAHGGAQAAEDEPRDDGLDDEHREDEAA